MGRDPGTGPYQLVPILVPRPAPLSSSKKTNSFSLAVGLTHPSILTIRAGSFSQSCTSTVCPKTVGSLLREVTAHLPWLATLPQCTGVQWSCLADCISSDQLGTTPLAMMSGPLTCHQKCGSFRQQLGSHHCQGMARAR